MKGLQGEPGSAGLPERPPRRSRRPSISSPTAAPKNGRDQGDAKISETELRDIHNAGYVPAIEAGVQTVMISFSSWNGVKHHRQQGPDHRRAQEAHELRRLHRRRLERARPGRRLHQRQLPAGVERRPRHVHGAGQLARPVRKPRQAGARTARCRWSGSTMPSRASCASSSAPACSKRVRRRKRPLAGDFKMLAAPEHRALAREAVRQSLVLLKNNGGLLPLAANKHVLVTGDGADNIGKQSGGWTITWQGTGLNQRELPGRHVGLGRREGGGQGRRRQRRAVDRRHRTRRSPTTRSSCSARIRTPNSRATSRC